MTCPDCRREVEAVEICGPDWICDVCHRERQANGPCPCEAAYTRADAENDWVDDHIYPDGTDV